MNQMNPMHRVKDNKKRKRNNKRKNFNNLKKEKNLNNMSNLKILIILWEDLLHHMKPLNLYKLYVYLLVKLEHLWNPLWSVLEYFMVKDNQCGKNTFSRLFIKILKNFLFLEKATIEYHLFMSKILWHLFKKPSKEHLKFLIY